MQICVVLMPVWHLNSVTRHTNNSTTHICVEQFPGERHCVAPAGTGAASCQGRLPGVYLGPCSRFLLVAGVLVQLKGLLLLIDLVEAVHLEELEVLQLGHLGQAGATRPAVSHHTPQSGVVLHAKYFDGIVHNMTACYVILW